MMIADSTLQANPARANSVPELTGTSREQQGNAAYENTSLPAVLRKFDLVVLLVLIVLFVANNNAVQFAGPSAMIYWGIGLITFLIPCAYVTRWLARRYPGQGAPYLWAVQVLGQRWGFFSAFCAWMPGVLVIVSIMQSCLIFMQYLAPNWFISPAQQGIAIILLLVIPTSLACLPLRWLKRVLLAVTSLYVSVFALIGCAGVYWLATGHAPATSLNSPSAWLPSSSNFAVYGVVILAYLGVDVPMFMGGEIRGGAEGTRRASSYVWWGSAIVFLGYVLGTFGVMVVVPPASAGGMSANILAVQRVFGAQAGDTVAVILAISQLFLTTAYILLYSRLLVIIGQERRIPVGLTKLNRWKVPARSIVTQSSLSGIIALISLLIVPIMFGSFIKPDALALEVYNILQASATVIWVFSGILLFVFVLRTIIARKNRADVPRWQRLVLLGLSCMGVATSLIGIWATISSSWLPGMIPDTNWAILVTGITLVSFVSGLLGSELPRVYALLHEQKRLNDREVTLRGQLQEAYDQQQVLLAELDRLYHEQAQAAVTDAVTGLPNHRAVISRLDEELARCRRNDSSCAVVFVDLDHFKRVNDTWGHRAGDIVLREVGERLRSCVRQEDFVGRYGGEEFALILSGADLLGATQAANRLLVALNAEPCTLEQDEAGNPPSIFISGSIGVAVYSLHGSTREELIEAADHAMYTAKRAGRNRVCIADVGHSMRDGQVVEDEYASLNENHTREVVGIQALTAAAAARDLSTYTHAYRLVQLALSVGRQLALSEEEMHLLRLGAILHDIGKIGIPDAILHKPGPLTDEEWAVMKEHPEIGRRILEELGGTFRALASLVVAHHERWDGTGYPYGLAGTDIPLGARILTVVDAFDAMTSQRPYRKPMPIEAARTELQRCSGTQFDPEVVNAFLAALDEQSQAEPLAIASPTM
ncbi:MAG TPA: amino acid permease [Ktedonobacteraceae bacterium]|jgi:diguanylate cyclase (GGDEF)-like protein|nr:amino acid permease [Ktedonobacteraceae bacterium]